MIDVAVLLSVGRHPASARPRRSPTDAKALEMALALPAGRRHAVHAGDPSAAVLRDYLGMGLDRLSVLDVPAGHDPVGPLAGHLAAAPFDVILAGTCAEGGEDSGMVPYLIAHALDRALVPDVVGITVDDGGAEVLQALPRGQRRSVRVAFPFVATVHPAAPAARMPAYAVGRRGRIERLETVSVDDAFVTDCVMQPWRQRPKLMRVQRGGSALDRLKAATETKAGKGQLLVGVPPEEAAKAIVEWLVERGVL